MYEQQAKKTTPLHAVQYSPNVILTYLITFPILLDPHAHLPPTS